MGSIVVVCIAIVRCGGGGSGNAVAAAAAVGRDEGIDVVVGRSCSVMLLMQMIVIRGRHCFGIDSKRTRDGCFMFTI